MDQNIQLGFLIGVYFMASAVVALTLMYLSRPRHKKPITPTGGLAAKTGPNVSEPASSDKPIEKKNPAEIGQPTHNRETRPEIPAPLVQEEPQGNKNRVPTGSANLPVAQVLPATPVSEIPKKPPTEEIKITPLSVEMEPQPAVKSRVEAKPQPAVNAPGPSVKVVNNLVSNKEEKIEMEEKPRPAKGTTDFAELFTEENDEDNEVDKLASELAEIETQDILDETRNLISRFKNKD